MEFQRSEEIRSEEIRSEEEVVLSILPSTMGTLQIVGSNGYGHSMEQFMPKTFSEIDIEEEYPQTNKDRPLPIFLKFVDVEFRVRNTHASTVNPWKMVASKVGQMEHDHYKYILKGVTGSIGPGEILALMGPSGSGKTTLLNILGGRVQENVRGTVTYNEMSYNSALKRRIGFVTQDDLLLPQLTVEETLMFAAMLRLPSNMSKQKKRERVHVIVSQLGLERCRNTYVFEISGGERKRTSIGYEILVDPSVLLLDEPTSGLDSTSANRLLQILQGIAKTGRTIITTIHQPSSRMFHMFDKLLLISDGYPMYSGKARDAIEYFSSLRFAPGIAMNPAEFLLDLATGQVNDISIPEDLSTSRETSGIERNVIKYLLLKFKVELEPKEKAIQQALETPEHLQSAVQVKKDWTMTWSEQFMVLLKRTFKQRRRDYFDMLRLAQTLGVSIMICLLWWNSKIGTEAQLRDQVGLLFYICIVLTSTSIFGAVYVFPFEKFYLVKETKTDMYMLSVYYMSSTLCDMVANIFYPTFFLLPVYFMTGFKQTIMCFFMTYLTTLLIVITSQGAGEFFGATVLNIKRAGMIASIALMVFLLTGGYYVQHVPHFMKWLKYTSFMYYGFRLMVKVQYSGDELYECDSKGGCRSLQSSPSFDTVNLSGGLEEVWVLLTMALCYRLCAYLCLRRKIKFLK